MTIQDKIIYYLAEKKIKQFELAQLIGITRVYLSEIINGRQPSKVLTKRIEIFLKQN